YNITDSHTTGNMTDPRLQYKITYNLPTHAPKPNQTKKNQHMHKRNRPQKKKNSIKTINKIRISPLHLYLPLLLHSPNPQTHLTLTSKLLRPLITLLNILLRDRRLGILDRLYEILHPQRRLQQSITIQFHPAHFL